MKERGIIKEKGLLNFYEKTKKIYLTSLFFIVSLLFALPRASSASELWANWYHGNGPYSAISAIALGPSGSIYVTGRCYDCMGTIDDTRWDIATIKYSPAGNQEWVALYNGSGDGEDVATDIVVDLFGNAYITGYSTGSGTGKDYVTIKYDSNGNEQWVASYNNPSVRGGVSSDDVSVGIAIGPSGMIYVTGGSKIHLQNGWLSEGYSTIKYDSSGNEQWIASYMGPDDVSPGSPADIALDSSENIYVTGLGYDFGSSTDNIITIKYDSSGNEQWVALEGRADLDVKPSAIAVGSSGNVYMLGSWENSSPWDPLSADFGLWIYNSNGVSQGGAFYDGPAAGRDIPTALDIDSSGNIYVTGTSDGIGTNSDYVTIKYDSNGLVLWEVRYNSPENGYDGATALAVDPSGNVYVTGSTWAPSSKNITTVKYNSSGTEMGVARYDTNSQQYTSVDIAVDISGNIYVAGSGEDANPWSDYLTIKYRIDNFNIIKRGPGNGTITSNIPGIDCGSDCSEDFTVNSVTLTVTTDPGSFFAGWSGDNDCSDGVVSIDMDVVTTCIATFNRIEITDLGTLGGDNSRARAINESGQIVGRSELPSGYIHATLWENGILTDLGTIGGLNSEAFDINRWGTVVGGGAIGTPLADKSSNFLWDVDSGIVQLNAPLVYPAAISSASDLYPKITGELTDFTGAAIWDVGFEAIHRNLGTLGGNRAVPNAINNFDEVTGYSTTAAGEIRAFSYSYVDPTVGYVMQNLGLLSNFGFDTFGTDINNRSQIVGYEIASQVPSSRAFLWTAEDGMIDLGGLGGLGGGSVAYGISDKGHVVGRSWAPPGEWHAFFWTPYGGMVDLGGLSSGDSRASDINDNVEIVGRSTTPSGFEHATLWKLLNTATGDGITFDLGTQVSVTFGQVQTEGYTSLVERMGNPGGSASDGNFFFLGKYYNIKTTAIFNNSAGIEICINYLDADIPQGTNESDLKLTHLQGGYWVDITTSLDIDQNVICGIVNDLSWFAVAVQDTMTPDLLSMFEIKKAEVEWDKQKIKVHGEVGLPAGKDPFDVSPDGTVTISLSTLGQVVNQSVIFDVKGDEGKKWEYKDDSLSGVTKYKINWKGVKFDYNQEIRIKSNHIGEGSTALEVYPKGIKPLTIAVGGVTIDIDELGAVSVTPETLEIDIDDDGEIEVELPFTLTPDMTIVISGAVSDTVIVGDYYTAAVGKFKIEASFNPSGYDGDLTPATLSLEVTLGDVGYPGSFQIIESDWKKLKTIEWKYKR